MNEHDKKTHTFEYSIYRLQSTANKMRGEQIETK